MRGVNLGAAIRPDHFLREFIDPQYRNRAGQQQAVEAIRIAQLRGFQIDTPAVCQRHNFVVRIARALARALALPVATPVVMLDA